MISVILQGHDGVRSDHMYRISPKQVVSGQHQVLCCGATLACQ